MFTFVLYWWNNMLLSKVIPFSWNHSLYKIKIILQYIHINHENVWLKNEENCSLTLFSRTQPDSKGYMQFLGISDISLVLNISLPFNGCCIYSVSVFIFELQEKKSWVYCNAVPKFYFKIFYNLKLPILCRMLMFQFFAWQNRQSL